MSSPGALRELSARLSALADMLSLRRSEGSLVQPAILQIGLQVLSDSEGRIFYQIPRVLVMYLPYNLLLAAIYVGGLIYPLWTRGRRPSWYWPTYAGIVWAALTACASLPLAIAEWLNRPLPARHGELQEYFMYGFLFIYLYSLHRRLGASQSKYSPTPA